ncbi:hypothetical protein G7Y89_g4756 [Cudoniella acicularis]|uniref:Cytochrome P450 n=1 Tax=Cudoniella acicularis TaxID=354080 RepID=A0A8H4RQ45_9HELO|nr:hypothetical protein G7Y89_g4756 [Cudoniella acicularis]
MWDMLDIFTQNGLICFSRHHLAILLLILGTCYSIYLRANRFSGIPGPKLYALTKWRLAFEDWKGTRTRTIHQLHQKYGPVVRVGPNELSFNSLSALKTIYGAGSGFERTSFYRMFDVYGHQNLFTFASPKDHGERKKLRNHAYSKSAILKTSVAAIEEKSWEYLRMLKTEPEACSEIFTSLHYYSLDNITYFLYGPDGATSALTGSVADRALLNDVLDPARRKLSWFATHFPRYIKWVMSRTGKAEKLISFLGLLPQKKPTVYTGIRRHALWAWEQFSSLSPAQKAASKTTTIVGRLWDSHISQRENGLSDLEIASEAADHLLAGVDTTADTLMFLIWALSLPENSHFQEKLKAEVSSMPLSGLKHRGMLDFQGIPTVEATGTLSYLDAVVKETLRLYAPLPASVPRSLPVSTVIDGYNVSANTVVSMSPYNLHRNPAMFPEPLTFYPDRWLGDSKDISEMKKSFWAFSSGGRILAMAEMTTLTAAIYREYRTRVRPGTENMSPGITSRFEVFYDESKQQMKAGAQMLYQLRGAKIARITSQVLRSVRPTCRTSSRSGIPTPSSQINTTTNKDHQFTTTIADDFSFSLLISLETFQLNLNSNKFHSSNFARYESALITYKEATSTLDSYLLNNANFHTAYRAASILAKYQCTQETQEAASDRPESEDIVIWQRAHQDWDLLNHLNNTICHTQPLPALAPKFTCHPPQKLIFLHHQSTPKGLTHRADRQYQQHSAINRPQPTPDTHKKTTQCPTIQTDHPECSNHTTDANYASGTPCSPSVSIAASTYAIDLSTLRRPRSRRKPNSVEDIGQYGSEHFRNLILRIMFNFVAFMYDFTVRVEGVRRYGCE